MEWEVAVPAWAAVAVAAASLTHTLWNSRRERKGATQVVASVEKNSLSLEKDLAAIREEVATLQRELGNAKEAVRIRQLLEAQRLAQRHREQDWKKTKDVLRGAGWLLRDLDAE